MTIDLTLPVDSEERKSYPMYRGLLLYFPAALAGVAQHSKIGNDKHNPGEEMHHSRGKSCDHADAIIRHLVDLGDVLASINRGQIHSERTTLNMLFSEVDALAWRALALSQELYEKYVDAPLAPAARAEEEKIHGSVITEGHSPKTYCRVREVKNATGNA